MALFVQAAQEATVDPLRHEANYESWSVKRAEQFIEANLVRPLRVTQIARAAGVSTRTLNRGFRKRHGIVPKSYVQSKRLALANQALHTAAPDQTTVTDVAMQLGFWHLGQFAADYRKQFGELPTRTLAR